MGGPRSEPGQFEKKNKSENSLKLPGFCDFRQQIRFLRIVLKIRGISDVFFQHGPCLRENVLGGLSLRRRISKAFKGGSLLQP